MSGPGPEDETPRVMEDGPPPFLGTWTRVYTVVLCYLAVVIFAFWLFERAVTR